MLRTVPFLPSPSDPHRPARECACCGARYTVKRRGMRLFFGDTPEGEICPECVLSGPAGAAGRVRERLASSVRRGGGAAEGSEGASWARLLKRRARLLEATRSFPLAARQAAVRETRERR